MKNIFLHLVVTLSVVLLAVNARAGLFDELKSVVSSNTTAAGPVSNLPEDQVVSGLKEALSQGVTDAVGTLGQNDGFLTNMEVKIPVPSQMESVEKALRYAGQGQLADDFIASMNHAAEQAVPVAADVFGDSIKQMTIEDAKGILAGPDNAATQYFRRTTQTNLYAQFYPIVQKSTDSVGVTEKYKAMMGKFASINTLNSFGSLLGNSSPAILQAADLDKYVTNKALEGLYKRVADEEKNIRSNPAARTTDLLQKVFASTQ